MTRAKISELKNNLSSYLAKVRAGETVLVLDRNTPVARIVPPEPEKKAEALKIREPSLPFDLAGLPKVKLLKPVDVVELLREDRDER